MSKFLKRTIKIFFIPFCILAVWLSFGKSLTNLFVSIIWFDFALIGSALLYFKEDSRFAKIRKTLVCLGFGIMLLQTLVLVFYCCYLTILNMAIDWPLQAKICLISFVLCVFSIILWMLSVKISSNFKLIVFSRILALSLIPITITISTFLVVGYVFLYESLGIFHKSSIVVVTFVLLDLGIVALFISNEFHLFYPGENECLFLRSFEYEKKNQEIPQFVMDILKNNNIRPLTIGNPKELSIFAFLGSKHFFLPNTDWKTALDYYIYKAKNILVIIDTTPGVLWEIFTHFNFVDKFIYIVDDKSKFYKLMNIIKEIPEYKVFCSILKLLENHVTDRFVFCLKGNKFFYGSIESSLNVFINGQESSTFIQIDQKYIKSLTSLNLSQEEIKKKMTTERKMEFWSRLEKFRIFLMSLPIKIFSFALLILKVLIILLGLFAFGLMIIGISELLNLYGIVHIPYLADLSATDDLEGSWAFAVFGCIFFVFGLYVLLNFKKWNLKLN